MDSRLVEIDKLIKAYLAKGGSLSDPNLPFDKPIKTYVSNMNKKKRKMLETNPDDPICKMEFSKDNVLISLGYTPVVKHRELNILRCFEEIDAYILAGGKMDKKVKEYPFYHTIKKFIEKEKAKGIKISYDEIMGLKGFYQSDFTELYDLVEKYADENGCLDSIRETRDYNTIRSKAATFGCSPTEYVTLFSDCYFSKAVLPVDNYIKNLKKELVIALKGNNDASGLRNSYPELYQKVKHLRMYFPEGSLVSIEETFNVLGFSYKGVYKPFKPVNEKYMFAKLEALHPTKVIDKLDHKDPLTKTLLLQGLKKNMFLPEYLRENGFTYNPIRSSTRLTQTNAADKLNLLREINEKTAIEYNQKKMGLKYVCNKRVLKSGKVIVSKPVVSPDSIIYMPSVYDMDKSKKEVGHLALEEFRTKHM